MLATIRVKSAQLMPGDELANDTGTYVDSVWNDPEGIWVDFTDGYGISDAGYVNANSTWKVLRYLPGD